MSDNDTVNNEEESQERPSPDPKTKDDQFPIVAVGASAGGLHAYSTFFDNLPDQPDMAFVLIQHLDPHHESELAEILQNHTAMPVKQVEDQEKIYPSHVYVIPPGQSLAIKNGNLRLSDPDEPRGQRASIDLFFRSLADDQGENAVCVILSGTGSDGTLGLKRIKEQGGVVLVQAPEDAEYEGMPQSALKTGMVDMAAPVDKLAQKLIEYRQSAQTIQFPGAEEGLAEEEASVLNRIFTQLESRTGADFSQYKRSTILRRLQRRMQMTQTANLDDYMRLLRRDHAEARSLFKNFLISVTNFFRDEEAWAALANDVLPAIFEEKSRSDTIRVWAPGCATGEEAYSLAILLLEEARRHEQSPNLQIFATDLDREAITFARRGLYPEAIIADVSQERLERFFDPVGSGYRVRSSVQEVVLFAEHNLVKDAPFANLDLISCRNLLIYLERDIQERVFQIFRYALGEGGGYLFLGSSESVTQTLDMFEPLRKRKRIYRTRSGKPPLPQLPVRINRLHQERETEERDGREKKGEKKPSLGTIHRQLMLERYAPPSVLVDANYDICYKYGEVSRYLHHHEGEPSLNLLDNVADQIRVELRTGLFSVFRHREAVRPRRVRLEEAGQVQRIRLRIEPAPSVEGRDGSLALVIFEPLPSRDRPETDESEESSVDTIMVRQLEAEIRELRRRLQTTVEEYETSNEELKSSNEELQSMNEELRSTTEELKTSREELRSTNEELTSVNQELKTKLEELKEANSDLENLMKATDIATLFLNRKLCLKRYTPEATDLFNIIPSDIGRPFSHISHKIDYDTLPDLAEQVLKTLETIEKVVPSTDDRWFLMEMRPYRTVEDKIDGVVITLVEMTTQVEAERRQRVDAKRQAAVARLGQQALQRTEVDELLDLVVRQVAQTLDVPIAHVLTILDGEDTVEDGDALLLAAGIGWDREKVGTLTLPAGGYSQAGYALETGEDVIVTDREEERRFHQAKVFEEMGIQSGLNVIIRGQDGFYGVLGAYSREPREFDDLQLNFLRTVANVIGTAVSRQESEAIREELLAQVQEEQRRLQGILQQMPAGVVIAEAPGGRLLMGNDRVEEIWRQPYIRAETVEAYTQYSGFHLDGAPLKPDEWPLARTIATGEVIKGEEIAIERGDGTRAIISNSAGPIYDEDGNIVAGVVIFQDVTGRKAVEAERDRLLQEMQALTASLEERVAARTEELAQRGRQLSAVASALTVAEQRERERISQILHDDLQQLLHAVQLRVMILNNKLKDGRAGALNDVEEMEQLNSQALKITRSLTVELSPPVLEEEGLTEAFGWLANHMENAYGLQVSVATDGTDVANRDLRELAFQMVRELLFNIVKHADVDEARLMVAQADGRCHIIVADNGSGFDPSRLAGAEAYGAGYGLRSIEERLALFGGELNVEAAPGVGTQITITLPSHAVDAQGDEERMS